MAINTSWKVEIGTIASPTNFTSRVMGLSIDQSVDVNVIGRGICQITLLNKDGALTPGGGGTYSNTDWFAQGIFVSALTNTGGADTTTAVFHGIVTDFDLLDDGVYSTVTITAIDSLTLAGKSSGFSASTIASIDYNTAISVYFTAGGAVKFPYLGQALRTIVATNQSGETTTVKSDVPVSFTTYADLWQTALTPSANDVLWATTILPGAGTTTYNLNYIPITNTRATNNRVSFTFNPANAISGTALPFMDDSFQQSFNNDTLITSAIVKGNYTSAVEIQSDATTINTYGSRTVSYLSTLVVDATAATRQANLLQLRYSTSRFNPVSLKVTASAVKARAADAAKTYWESLLGISSGLWQKATITWTGSGASSQTANCVIKGRQINVTPDDAVVTLTLGNWVDNHSFILDTDKLNTDRLG